MSPEMQALLKQKETRRIRLAMLPYPEKVRIATRMREAALKIKAVTNRRLSKGS